MHSRRASKSPLGNRTAILFVSKEFGSRPFVRAHFYAPLYRNDGDKHAVQSRPVREFVAAGTFAEPHDDDDDDGSLFVEEVAPLSRIAKTGPGGERAPASSRPRSVTSISSDSQSIAEEQSVRSSEKRVEKPPADKSLYTRTVNRPSCAIAIARSTF